MASVLERLVAAKHLLASADGDRTGVSKCQSDAVLALMQTTTVAAEDVGSIAAAVSEVSWATSSELSALLAAVGGMVKTPKKARVQMQDFEQVCAFLTQPLWELLLGSSDFFVKAEAAIEHFISLGLRNPSERSVANLTSLILLCCEGEAAKAMSTQQLRDTFLHMKAMIKRRLPKTASDVQRLGSSPAEFSVSHPAIYKRVFSEFPPVASRVDAFAVYTMGGSSIKMRDRGSASSSSSMRVGAVNDMQGMMQQAFVMAMQSMVRPQLAQHVPLTIFKGGHSTRMLFDRRPSEHALLSEGSLASASEACAEAQSANFVAAAATEGKPVAIVGDTPVPPSLPIAKPLPKRLSVDEAAAAVLKAMGKKSEDAVNRVVKRPAAACAASGTAEWGSKPPIVSIEASRSQVLYRSGLRGKGQSKTFKYTDAKSKKVAIAKANEMVVAEKRRRGLA